MKMATREFVFEVRYGGHIDRRFMNSYVGGDVDVYTDAIPHDRVSLLLTVGVYSSKWVEINHIEL